MNGQSGMMDQYPTTFFSTPDYVMIKRAVLLIRVWWCMHAFVHILTMHCPVYAKQILSNIILHMCVVVFAISHMSSINCIANTLITILYNNSSYKKSLLYLYRMKPNKRITCLQMCKCMHNYNNISKQVVYSNVLKLG